MLTIAGTPVITIKEVVQPSLTGLFDFAHPTQDYVLGYLQPSLTGLFDFAQPTQDYVLGYLQPSLTGLFDFVHPTQEYVLGYLQPSLRGWVQGSGQKPRTQKRDLGHPECC